MAIISIKNLNKTYISNKKDPGVWAGIKNLFNPRIIEVEAVKNVNFEIQKGEFVGFLGPNGAGKTTTLKMLSGIIKPTSGEISVMGFDPWEKKTEYKKKFALLMGQKNQLWWDLPVMESFLLNREIYDIPKDEFEKTLNELVELLDIKKILDVQVRRLSLGERMKCELVASILHSPEVLFLDEPTIGLDVVAQNNIRDFLKKYNQEKKITIILTSHYMEDIEKLCKRIIIINQEIFYDGLLSNLIEKYAKNKILRVTFEDSVKEEDIKKFGTDYEFDPVDVKFKFPREQVREKAKEILSSDLPVDDIMIDEVEVESIIRDIFRKVNE